ncbi:glutaredoxin domain-containing protein [Streptomyces sp. NRRL F-5123]|uniref:glutaredoxin domain-containing protein n=1 Tax=Streptomyces sp. NRRL F-5123 TaxID=1463856 RepID=UPI0004E215B0|nr:glutaredoxin domain-containing protein [Streptomyces sp. NRRL F-5123]
MMRVWGMAVGLLVVGGVCGGLSVARGDYGTGGGFVGGFLVLAGVNSPLFFPRSVTAAEAERRSAEDGRAVVYWRPGCAYCLRLRARLGWRARRAHWVNIWRDPAGAAAVREVNGGNETVPTVVVAGRAHTNPDPAWLRGRLAGS